MTYHIPTSVNLKKYTTMRIGGEAKHFTNLADINDLKDIIGYAKENSLNIFPIGGGSNTIFSDLKKNDLDKYLFVLVQNKGIQKTYENDDTVNVTASAGEDWDEFVGWCVENDLKGLECLSGIPGTVGAGPIQNIGAYGSEISNTLTSVEVYDIENEKTYNISNADCDFRYRDSIFKQNIGRFIILSVSFSLSKIKDTIQIPEYKDVQLYFLDKKKKKATVREIREAILKIRGDKIPWPTDIPNTGSFFKNPIVDQKTAGILARSNPEMPYYVLPDAQIKLYAGWLIENVDLKGCDFGKIKINEKNALILTNPQGRGSFSDLLEAIDMIQERVGKEYGIRLEVEPNIVK
jgi:UDP-N-acetylmuramate dehydrogenase